MAVSMDLIKKLRDMTGAGIMECRKALEETNGDIEKALEVLRKRGATIAEKKSSRATKEGLIVAYVHFNGRVGVLLEMNCETDFVARTDEFKELAYNLAKQVAAMSPKYIRKEDVPAEVIEREREVYREQVKDKPAEVAEKIVEGKLEKFFEEVCLYEQKYIFDEAKKVKDLINELIAKTGENVRVSRFVRYELGEIG